MGKIEEILSKLQNLYIHEFKESETELIEICHDIIDKVSDALTSNKKVFYLSAKILLQCESF